MSYHITHDSNYTSYKVFQNFRIQKISAVVWEWTLNGIDISCLMNSRKRYRLKQNSHMKKKLNDFSISGGDNKNRSENPKYPDGQTRRGRTRRKQVRGQFKLPRLYTSLVG